MAVLFLLLSLLFYQSARSDSVCDVGTPIIDDIPSTYLHGTWVVAFVRPKTFSEGLRCWADKFTSRADGGIDILTSVTELDTGERLSFPGTVDINGRFLKYNYSTFPEMSGNYEILAWEDNKFQIGGGCVEMNNYEPLNWISLPESQVTGDNLRAAKEAVNKMGLKFEDFAENC